MPLVKNRPYSVGNLCLSAALFSYKIGNIFPWHGMCYAIFRVTHCKKYLKMLARAVLCKNSPKPYLKKTKPNQTKQ